MQLISIGADPELFLKKGPVISSSIGLIGGSKYDPKMIHGYGLQEDNVLAEYSMPAVNYFGCAASMTTCFRDRILRGIDLVRREVQPKGLTISKKSSHLFNRKRLDAWGPAALEFGCDPDYNAYTGDVNPTPDNTSCMRTAGGHVHVGCSMGGNQDAARAIAMSMDLFLGVPSVLLDADTRRRSMYGKAGAYRLKPYGLEYRSLSNFWIHDYDLISFIAKQTIKAVDNADSIELLHTFVSADMIQDCINTSNVDMAKAICKEFKITLPSFKGGAHEKAA